MTDKTGTLLVAQLTRIADCLEKLTAPGETPTCVHPGESVTDLSTMGHPRFECDPRKGGCGFRYGSGWTPDELEAQGHG